MKTSRLRSYARLLLLAGNAAILVTAAFPGLRPESTATYTYVGGESTYASGTGYVYCAYLLVIPGAVLHYLTGGTLVSTLLWSSPFLLSRIWLGWDRASLLNLVLSLSLVPGIARLRPETTKPPASRARLRPRGLIASLAMCVIVALTLFLLAPLGHDRAYFQRTAAEGEALTDVLRDIVDLNRGFWFHSRISVVAGFEASALWVDRVPSESAYQLGIDYLYRFFIQPIPRMWWPGKPTPGTLKSTLLPLGSWEQADVPVGMAPGSVGNAYRQLGHASVVLLFLALGYVLGRSEVASCTENTGMARLLWSILVFGLVPMLVRDGLVALAPYLLWYGLPCLCVRLGAGHNADKLAT